MFSLLIWQEFQDLLSTSWCQVLGQLSFSIYLLHYQILIVIDILIMPYLGPVMSPTGKHDRTGAAIFCLFIFIIPLVYLVSVPFYRYCDDLSVALSNDFRQLFVRGENSCCWTCCSCLVEKKRVTNHREDENNKLENGRIGQGQQNYEQSSSSSVGGQCQNIDWKSKKMILLYAIILFIIIGAIPAKEYCDCYSSDAEGGILN
jgi:hypothetical protein